LNRKLLGGENGKNLSEEEAVVVAVGLDGWHHSRAELDAFPVRDFVRLSQTRSLTETPAGSE